MPRGMFRSHRLRRIFVRVPGGQTRRQYRERKPQGAKCASCKKQLQGVPRELPSVMANLPKTVKRPERPYGGNLCSTCMRRRFRETARGESA